MNYPEPQKNTPEYHARQERETMALADRSPKSHMFDYRLFKDRPLIDRVAARLRLNLGYELDQPVRHYETYYSDGIRLLNGLRRNQ
jgi:hypothetical protein